MQGLLLVVGRTTRSGPPPSLAPTPCSQCPKNSIPHREGAANLAIGEAVGTILRGSADIMVVGATGTRVHPMKTVHAAQTEELAGNGVEPSKASRPFDKNRTGMVIGEGAGSI